jgi:hypothetical protein
MDGQVSCPCGLCSAELTGWANELPILIWNDLRQQVLLQFLQFYFIHSSGDFGAGRFDDESV